MGYKIGVDCKAYRNSGTWANATWSELTDVSEATINQERGEAELVARGFSEALFFSAIMRRGVDFQLVYNSGDTDYEAIKDAFHNNTLIDLAFLDGNVNTNGTQGFRAEFNIFQFNVPQPLEEGSVVDVTVRPSARSTQTPTWMEV